jgi:hypothetical protein
MRFFFAAVTIFVTQVLINHLPAGIALATAIGFKLYWMA